MENGSPDARKRSTKNMTQSGRHYLRVRSGDNSSGDRSNKSAGAGEELSRVYSARFYPKDLERLEQLAEATGISTSIWLRQGLRAIIEEFDRKGAMTVPFVIVSRDEAERAGLVPSQKKREDL